MRHLTLTLALLPLLVVGSPLRIHVHSTDRIVVVPVYQCTGVPLTQYMGAGARKVMQPGQVSWQARGGTPPYRLVDVQDFGNGIVITVQDAAGREVTRSITVRTRFVPEYVDCPGAEPGQPPLPPTPATTPTATKKNATTTQPTRTSVKPRPKEERGGQQPRPSERTVQQRQDTPRPQGGRPATTYRSTGVR